MRNGHLRPFTDRCLLRVEFPFYFLEYVIYLFFQLHIQRSYAYGRWASRVFISFPKSSGERAKVQHRSVPCCQKDSAVWLILEEHHWGRWKEIPKAWSACCCQTSMRLVGDHNNNLFFQEGLVDDIIFDIMSFEFTTLHSLCLPLVTVSSLWRDVVALPDSCYCFARNSTGCTTSYILAIFLETQKCPLLC